MYYDEYCYWAQMAVLLMYLDFDVVGTGYVLRVELPVQRRLCLIFVRDVGSPDIHECFRGLMGGQRTPGIWGFTLILGTCSTLFKAKVFTEVSFSMTLHFPRT